MRRKKQSGQSVVYKLFFHYDTAELIKQLEYHESTPEFDPPGKKKIIKTIRQILRDRRGKGEAIAKSLTVETK